MNAIKANSIFHTFFFICRQQMRIPKQGLAILFTIIIYSIYIILVEPNSNYLHIVNPPFQNI